MENIDKPDAIIVPDQIAKDGIGKNRSDGVRDAKGRLLPGHPDLGAGHPLGKPNMRTTLKKLLEMPLTKKQVAAMKKFKIENITTADTNQTAILARLISTASISKMDAISSSTALSIMEQVEGKQVQRIEQRQINVDGNLNDLSDDQLRDYITSIDQRLADRESSGQEDTAPPSA
jgi:hypothetical protein